MYFSVEHDRKTFLVFEAFREGTVLFWLRGYLCDYILLILWSVYVIYYLIDFLCVFIIICLI